MSRAVSGRDRTAEHQVTGLNQSATVSMLHRYRVFPLSEFKTKRFCKKSTYDRGAVGKRIVMLKGSKFNSSSLHLLI